jgi:hypothetical protein
MIDCEEYPLFERRESQTQKTKSPHKEKNNAYIKDSRRIPSLLRDWGISVTEHSVGERRRWINMAGGHDIDHCCSINCAGQRNNS